MNATFQLHTLFRCSHITVSSCYSRFSRCRPTVSTAQVAAQPQRKIVQQLDAAQNRYAHKQAEQSAAVGQKVGETVQLRAARRDEMGALKENVGARETVSIASKWNTRFNCVLIAAVLAAVYSLGFVEQLHIRHRVQPFLEVDVCLRYFRMVGDRRARRQTIASAHICIAVQAVHICLLEKNCLRF